MKEELQPSVTVARFLLDTQGDAPSVQSPAPRRTHPCASERNEYTIGVVKKATFGANYGHIDMSTHNHVHVPSEDAQDSASLEHTLQWLDGSNFAKSLKTAWDQHMPGTGKWFFRSKAFRRLAAFTRGAGGVVVCGLGSPGAGKTILASAAVMHLRNMLKGQEEAVVVHAFLRFDENHSTRGILAGLVGQLLQHRGSNSPTRSSRLRIVLAYHATEDALEEKELAEVFASLIDTFERVFVVIDGLDEVPENVRESLLATLIPCSQIGLLMTSRPLSHVIAHYAPHAECVTIQAHAEDLSVYVSERAKQSAKLQAILRISGQGDRLVKELSERIQEVSRGMFLVAHLQMEAVLHNANNVATLFDTLEALPSGLRDAYRNTLSRIDAQSKGDSSLAQRVFIWLLYAGSKVSAQFMQCALAVSHDKLSYNRGDMVPISLVLSACRGLVEVRQNSNERNNTLSSPDEVSFIHATTQEFMKTLTFDEYPNPHELLCITCLVYLKAHPGALRVLKKANGGTGLEEALLSSGHWSEMLMYSLANWRIHAQEAAKSGPLHHYIAKALSVHGRRAEFKPCHAAVIPPLIMEGSVDAKLEPVAQSHSRHALSPEKHRFASEYRPNRLSFIFDKEDDVVDMDLSNPERKLLFWGDLLQYESAKLQRRGWTKLLVFLFDNYLVLTKHKPESHIGGHSPQRKVITHVVQQRPIPLDLVSSISSHAHIADSLHTNALLIVVTLIGGRKACKLYTLTAQARLEWQQRLEHAVVQRKYTQRLAGFSMDAISLDIPSASVKLGDGSRLTGRVTCCVPFTTSDGCRLVAVGCENGLWIGRSNDHTPLRPVLPNLKKITQCAVLVSSGILLVLAEKALLAYPLESAIESSLERTRSWDAAPYRLNGSKVYFFAIGAIQGRTLIAYVSRKWGKTVVRVVQPAVNLGVDLSQEDGTTKLTSRFRVFRSALCGEWFRVFREYLWPERLSGLFFLRDSIVAVCTSGFKIADPIKSQTRTIPDFERLPESLARRCKACRPIGIVKYSDDRYLFCYNEFGWYGDGQGRPISPATTVQWEGVCEHIAHCSPYLLLVHSDFIEVRRIETVGCRLAQIIPGNDIHCVWNGHRRGSSLSLGIVGEKPDSAIIRIVMGTAGTEGGQEEMGQVVFALGRTKPSSPGGPKYFELRDSLGQRLRVHSEIKYADRGIVIGSIPAVIGDSL